MIFNSASKAITINAEERYSLVCKSGTICANTDGTATNIGSCICGNVECVTGSTCKSSTSLCTLVDQAAKIVQLEASQNQCSSTCLLDMKAEIALLKKQYEGIDQMCKTTDPERRLATAVSGSGCGGGVAASLDNTMSLTPGEIAAIVIVPIVVILGCAGAFMYMQQSQKEKKTPENLYELKNFTPKNATVELFDVRGSMNSNNPLANVVVSGSNPMLNQNKNVQQKIATCTTNNNDELQVNVSAESPLPMNWEKVDGRNGGEDSYYWNTETDETQFDRPL